MADLELGSRIKLNDGNSIPVMGLGTWQMADDGEAEDAVFNGLKMGYRLIDTAKIYGNERGVGAGIRRAVESGIPREDIFVTTKLWNFDHGNVDKGFEESRKRLGLDYVDLYLIHWPGLLKQINTWRKMEKLLDRGKVRSIGVSNFSIKHIKELIDADARMPAVNQIHLNPWHHERDLVDFCKQNGILIEAYSPLTRGRKLKSNILDGIAEKYNKTSAQVLIRWCIQHGTVPIPKSSNAEHIQGNADVFGFSIDENDMNSLDSL